jgi:hypothetical protein
MMDGRLMRRRVNRAEGQGDGGGVGLAGKAATAPHPEVAYGFSLLVN